MSEEKVDLSALDPSRDEARWEALVQSVVARALARRRPSVSGQLRAWAMPALAVAAAIPLLVWAGTVAYPRQAETPAARQAPSSLVAGWAARDQLPSTAELIQALGGDDEHH